MSYSEIIEFLDELKDDPDSNKRFKEKATHVISILSSNEALACEKALIQLEELNSLDLPSYHRTQVWDVISMLESTKNS